MFPSILFLNSLWPSLSERISAKVFWMNSNVLGFRTQKSKAGLQYVAIFHTLAPMFKDTWLPWVMGLFFCLPPAGPKSLASLWHPLSLVYSWQSLSGWRRQRSANFHPIGKMWRPDFAHLFSFTWFTMRNCGPLVFPKDDTCMVLDKQGISQKEDKGILL